MPAFNIHVNYLEEAIESNTDKTYSKWQNNISEDASTKHGIKKLLIKF